MSKWDKYAPDYRKIYPGVTITPPVLRVLRQSDRKMKYCEFDLKTDRKRENKRTGTVTVAPAREDSLERLAEESNRQYALEDASLEETLAEKDEIERLHRAMLQLEPDEFALIHAIYYEGVTVRAYAKKIGKATMTVQNQKVRIQSKLKKLLA